MCCDQFGGEFVVFRSVTILALDLWAAAIVFRVLGDFRRGDGWPHRSTISSMETPKASARRMAQSRFRGTLPRITRLRVEGANLPRREIARIDVLAIKSWLSNHAVSTERGRFPWASSIKWRGAMALRDSSELKERRHAERRAFSCSLQPCSIRTGCPYQR